MTAAARLVRATPEAQGVRSDAVLACIEALDARLAHMHSLMVVRRGLVIAEGWWAPYRADLPHALFSLSKSITSTAIGLLAEEGRLSLDDRVIDLLPDAAPEALDERLGAMRLRHLLSMSTGQARDGLEEAGAGAWAPRILGVPVVHDPGTRFMYQTGATYLLATIVTRITGERLLDHVTPRLLAPLGIEGATWERSPDGIDVGGWGLSMTTEDVAAFGQLYLQRGAWQGRQVVPAAWVATATMAHVDNGDPAFPSDWTQGYGFQFWRSRHGGYRGDGAFGQLCLVMPDQEVVVAATAGLPDMQEELDVLWETLLPALGDAGSLPPDPAGHARLVARLASLRLPTPAGAPTSPRLDARGPMRYRLDGGSTGSLTLVRSDDGLELALVGPGMDARLVCGHGRWLEGGHASTDGLRTGTDRAPSPLAGAFAWLTDDWLALRAWAIDTAVGWDVDVAFDGERVDLELRQNVAFVAPPVVHVTGVREPAA